MVFTKGIRTETLEKAYRLKELYLHGFLVKEICKYENINISSYFRLLKMIGGLSWTEKAIHYQNREYAETGNVQTEKQEALA